MQLGAFRTSRLVLLRPLVRNAPQLDKVPSTLGASAVKPMGPSVRWDHAIPEVSDAIRAHHRWSSAKGGVVLGALEQNFQVLG